jgi:hypothetical protein
VTVTSMTTPGMSSHHAKTSGAQDTASLVLTSATTPGVCTIVVVEGRGYGDGFREKRARDWLMLLEMG